MADDRDVNAETLRQKASAFRRLAGEILPGEFRKSLLELALEYDQRAASFDQRYCHAERQVTDAAADNKG